MLEFLILFFASVMLFRNEEVVTYFSAASRHLKSSSCNFVDCLARLFLFIFSQFCVCFKDDAWLLCCLFCGVERPGRPASQPAGQVTRKRRSMASPSNRYPKIADLLKSLKETLEDATVKFNDNSLNFCEIFVEFLEQKDLLSAEIHRAMKEEYTNKKHKQSSSNNNNESSSFLLGFAPLQPIPVSTTRQTLAPNELLLTEALDMQNFDHENNGISEEIPPSSNPAVNTHSNYETSRSQSSSVQFNFPQLAAQHNAHQSTPMQYAYREQQKTPQHSYSSQPPSPHHLTTYSYPQGCSHSSSPTSTPVSNDDSLHPKSPYTNNSFSSIAISPSSSTLFDEQEELFIQPNSTGPQTIKSTNQFGSEENYTIKDNQNKNWTYLYSAEIYLDGDKFRCKQVNECKKRGEPHLLAIHLFRSESGEEKWFTPSRKKAQIPKSETISRLKIPYRSTGPNNMLQHLVGKNSSTFFYLNLVTEPLPFWDK